MGKKKNFNELGAISASKFNDERCSPHSDLGRKTCRISNLLGYPSFNRAFRSRVMLSGIISCLNAPLRSIKRFNQVQHGLLNVSRYAMPATTDIPRYRHV